MGKIVICLLALLGMGVVGYAQPKLDVVGGTAISFGEVYSGSKAVRTVTLKNTGTDTLKIKDVAGTCGCTAALAASHNIAPNDTTSVTITFNTTGYLGGVGKTVRVTSNDPLTPTATITFTADVINLLKMTPTFFYFDSVRVGSVQTKTVQIKNTTASAIQILSIAPRDTLLFVKLHLKPFPKKLKPDEEADLIATLTAQRTGTVGGQIDIETDSKVQPKMFVRFNAVVKEK